MSDTAWTIRFKGYLPVDDRMEDRLRRVCAEIDKVPDAALDVDVQARVITVDYSQVKGWLEASRGVVRTVQAGERIVVKPPWEEYEPQPGQVVLEVDPETSFGSGLHESTRLCLRALEKHLQPGTAVVDFGTGSGILAIAAAKLGASHVTGLEADSEAVEAARSNVERNGLQGLIDIRHTDDPSSLSLQAGLVTANITAETIARHLDALARLLEVGGVLIASGMNDRNVDEVAQLLPGAGLAIAEKDVEGRWVALISMRR